METKTVKFCIHIPFGPQKHVDLHSLPRTSDEYYSNIGTSARADKNVWENNGLSGNNSDVGFFNENRFDLLSSIL